MILLIGMWEWAVNMILLGWYVSCGCDCDVYVLGDLFQIIIERQRAQEMLKDIEARHSDIVNLEQSLKQLYELFNDLAMLVSSQVEDYFFFYGNFLMQ